MISNLKSPIYVQVEITSNCNIRCSHCYNFWQYGPNIVKRRSLPINGWKQVAQTLGENDIFYATITGGEPFLEKKKLYKFLEFLREQNIRIMINSNATLLNEDDARKLSDSSVEIFLVSLMSYEVEKHNKIANSHSAFEKTMRGILMLQKYGINVAINTVATKFNYRDIYATGRWLYEYLGIKNYSATPICPSVPEHRQLVLNEKEVFETLNQLIELRDMGLSVDMLEVLPACLFTDSEDKALVEIFSKRMCAAGNTTITIGSEGDVRVCSYDRESYGNLLIEEFQNIWKRMGKWRDNSLLPQECKDCVVVESCGGGCRVNSKVRTGHYCELDYLSKGKIKEKQDTFFAERTEVQMDKEFSFLEDVFFRKEKDGVFVVVAGPVYFMAVNMKGMEVIKYLRGKDVFVPIEAIKAMGLDYKVGKEFFTELFNKGFFVETIKQESKISKASKEVIEYG